MPRKRILYLVHRTPYPPNRGHRIRSFHWLDYLAARCDLDVAFVADGSPSAETLEALRTRCVRVVWDVLGTVKSRFRAAYSLLSGRTATEGAFWSPNLFRQIRRWCEQTTYDSVLIYCSSMVPYLRALNIPPNNVIVDLVDVDSQKWLDYSRLSPMILAWLYRVEGRRLRRLECRLSQHARAVVLATDSEKRLFQTFCPHAHVQVIENGVDFDYFNPESDSLGPRSFAARLVFVGAMDYFPNADGVCWFLEHVWRVLAAKYPDLEFHIVGGNPRAFLRKTVARYPRVFLHSNVPDVRDYLAGSIVVVPLRIARGIQNKVLEAMAMACPVVATPQALDGIHALIGQEVLQATTPGEWTEQIGILLDFPDTRAALGRCARGRIQQEYGWSMKLRPLDEILQLI